MSITRLVHLLADNVSTCYMVYGYLLSHVHNSYYTVTAWHDPIPNSLFRRRRKAYFESMLYASLFTGMQLCCFVCPAHGTKGSDNAQASVHALYMVHTIPLLLSFAVCAAER